MILRALTDRACTRLLDDRMPLCHYHTGKGILPEAVRKITVTLQ